MQRGDATLTNGKTRHLEEVGGDGEDDTHCWKMVDVVIFCFSCPGCDEQVSNYGRGVYAITPGPNSACQDGELPCRSGDIKPSVHVTNKVANKQTRRQRF